MAVPGDVVLLAGGGGVVVFDGVAEAATEVTIGDLVGFFVDITVVGFLIVLIVDDGEEGVGLLVLVLSVVVIITAAGVVVRSLLTTDWNVVNSCISTEDDVEGTSFLELFDGVEVAAASADGNGTLIVVLGLDEEEDGRLEVVEPVPSVLSFLIALVAVVETGNFVESVAKTVVSGLVVGFLLWLLSTPEVTLIISKSVPAVIFWPVVEVDDDGVGL